MKKLFLISCGILLLVFISARVESRQPKYKALFNLSSDPKYYSSVNYKTSQSYEQTLSITFFDKRPEQERVYDENVQYFYDNIWTEPPEKMLGKLFVRELRSSGLFKSVDIDETNSSMVLDIELISLVGHYDEKGRVGRGTIKIRLILKSASDNQVLMVKTIEETKSSLVGRFSNAYRYMYRNIGDAVHVAVKEMMVNLENALRKAN